MPLSKEDLKPNKEDQPAPEPQPEVVDNKMHDKPQIAPDGHPNLSQEDIDNRA